MPLFVAVTYLYRSLVKICQYNVVLVCVGLLSVSLISSINIRFMSSINVHNYQKRSAESQRMQLGNVYSILHSTLVCGMHILMVTYPSICSDISEHYLMKVNLVQVCDNSCIFIILKLCGNFEAFMLICLNFMQLF
jgi:hypothetical protein